MGQTNTGGKKSSGAFIKGNEDGKFIEWYENGEKYREQNYIEGKRHGLKFSWYDTGLKKSSSTLLEA